MLDDQFLRVHTPNIAAQTIENETVIIDFASGMYYNTCSSGAMIWSALEAGATAKQIVEWISHQYDATPDAINSAVMAFLNDLLQEGLIVSEPRATPPNPLPDFPFCERQPFSLPTLQRYTDMAEALLLDPVHEIEDRGTK